MPATATKQEAFDLFEQHRADILLKARRIFLLHLINTGKDSTIEFLRDLVPLPSGYDPKMFGAVPQPFAKRAIIKKVGTTTTIRPEAHGRDISIWSLFDKDKAIRWLEDNPSQDLCGTKTELACNVTQEIRAIGTDTDDCKPVPSMRLFIDEDHSS